MALWARVADGIDVEAWLSRSLAAGVAFQTARRFDFEDRALPFVRLGFAAHDERELEAAVAILSKCR